MALLEVLQRIFMMLDGGLELFNILGATLSKGCLRLAIPLLPFFGCCINLA